mmetsp:Transcript_58285/g.157155  ORF Transcript_58285/g.157155 Transcript_58285/m.157155 type:complete len:223 (+) Transcript_58285:85-753(+)
MQSRRWTVVPPDLLRANLEGPAARSGASPPPCSDLRHETAIILRRAAVEVHAPGAEERLRGPRAGPGLHGAGHRPHAGPLVLRPERLHQRLGLPEEHVLARVLRLEQVVAHGGEGFGTEMPAEPRLGKCHLRSTSGGLEAGCAVKQIGARSAHVGVYAVLAAEFGASMDLGVLVEHFKRIRYHIWATYLLQRGARPQDAVTRGHRHVCAPLRRVHASEAVES